MSERARELAEHFEHESDAFVAAVERLSDVEWLTFCPGEERTAAALACHVADGYAVEVNAFRAIASGEPVRVWIRAALNAANAAGGREHAASDQAETVALLRREATAAAEFVRGLSDEQLARSGEYIEGLPAMTVDRWIERVLTGHPGVHLASIRAALGG